MLLKKTGDKVRTGEAIAIVSRESGDVESNKNKKDKGNKENITAATDRKHVLQIELWYKGSPVNPELYISF